MRHEMALTEIKINESHIIALLAHLLGDRFEHLGYTTFFLFHIRMHI